MRFSLAPALLAVVVTPAFAEKQVTDVFTDSSYDLFDNGLGNLDITSVTISQEVNFDTQLIKVSMDIQTRSIADWTKYMIFLGDGNGLGMSTNPWNRPIDLGGQVAGGFIGAWLDGGGGNQFWGTSGDGWTNYGGGFVEQTVDWESNSVRFSFLTTTDFIGVPFAFDVATSGGGSNDAGVDHLSRSDMAMGGWGQTSYAGEFLSFTIVPAPGAMGVMALAGLVGGRRRR